MGPVGGGGHGFERGAVDMGQSRLILPRRGGNDHLQRSKTGLARPGSRPHRLARRGQEGSGVQAVHLTFQPSGPQVQHPGPFGAGELLHQLGDRALRVVHRGVPPGRESVREQVQGDQPRRFVRRQHPPFPVHPHGAAALVVGPQALRERGPRVLRERELPAPLRLGLHPGEALAAVRIAAEPPGHRAHHGGGQHCDCD